MCNIQYMARLLNSNPEMLLTDSRHHLIYEALHEVKISFLWKKDSKFIRKEKLKKIILDIADRELRSDYVVHDDTTKVFHIIDACKLAKELLGMPDRMRWKLMYRVWLGMLYYSASMCRSYLHAKSLIG